MRVLTLLAAKEGAAAVHMETERLVDAAHALMPLEPIELITSHNSHFVLVGHPPGLQFGRATASMEIPSLVGLAKRHLHDTHRFFVVATLVGHIPDRNPDLVFGATDGGEAS